MHPAKPDARFYKDQGLDYVAQRKYHKAIQAFDNAIALDKEDLYSLRKVAECYRRLGQIEASVRCWDMLGKRLMDRGMYRQAIAAYTLVLTLDPLDTQTSYVIQFLRDDLLERKNQSLPDITMVASAD